MKKSSKKGFTLIEVMVTVALFSLVGVLCATLIFTGIRHSRQNAERSAFQIGVNKFVAFMNNHINSGENGEVSVAVVGNEITVEIKDGSTQIYSYDEETQQINFYEGSVEMILAPHVRAVEFNYYESMRLLNVKVQSDLDEGWLETSFYIR